MATIKSIEEKAKAYDEALKKAKDMLSYKEVRQEDIEYLFPELKESEDERIRKAIIELVKQSSEILEKKNQEQMIAWLEKQGEHTYNKELSELLHKVICRFINDPDIPYSDREKVSMKVLPYVERLEKQCEQKQPKELTNSEFVEKCKGLSRLEQHILALVPTRPIDAIKVDARTIRYLVEQEQGEQKPADKVEPKFKIGDKVHLINGSSPNYEDDCIVISDISNNTYYGNWEGGYFAIKDQDKYELVEQKPAWSEEDEKMYNAILRDVRNGEPLDKLQYDWLQSLKPQSTWKPSDEQIETLENVRKILHVNKEIYSKANNLMYNFEELIRTLKKLKEIKL